MVWTDARFGKPRLMFSYSKDKGKSWTEPKNLDPDVPEWSSQYQPMIYVNPEGILGLMWFDTRGSDKNDRYQLYFTASLDGGDSFLPSVIVSSAPSFPAAEINLVPSPLFGIHRGKSINVRTLSAFTRWADGGDYMGLTATPDGLFRPFWVDSHGRSFQVWTCQIDVKIEKESKPPNAAVASQEAVSKKQEKVLMNDKLELAFDPMRYDSSTRIAIIPVRLKNISKGSLRGPFLVRIKSLFPEGAAQEQLNIPERLDASNGKKGAGAEYDYSASLRDFEYLEPGGLTEAIEWTFKFTNPQFSRFISDLDLEVEIIGSAAQ
jgi:hypothetical protein